MADTTRTDSANSDQEANHNNAAAAEEPKKAKPGWRQVVGAFSSRKTWFMALFGFASGLPFALFLGTLYAWLSDAEVRLETMGVFSLIGLAYAFQFLWSPLIDAVNIPGFARLGKRKQWMVPAQILLGVILVALSFSHPSDSNMGWFSLLAGIGALASATQDIAINAWRIDNADEVATLDILSSVYQMGYRLASLLGGALALIIAGQIGWPQTYLMLGVILLLIGIVGLSAPDRAALSRGQEGFIADELLLSLRKKGAINPKVRGRALAVVGSLWAAVVVVLLWFMAKSMTASEADRPDPTEFTAIGGPLIIIATVVIPALIAGWLSSKAKESDYVLADDDTPATGGALAMDHLYRALVMPLVEFVGRLGWSLVLILALVLTYRICDAIWGTFAYPFYLGELSYTKNEVAFASKFFGIGAIILGLAIGGYMLTVLGRMLTLTIGALLAALTNLLYADLAVGGANMQAVSDMMGFTWVITQFPGGSPALAKLTITIAFENLAIGIAGAAFVAWLSSIVSKKFSAVQYALLSSMTLLVGTLGRGALGKMIEEQGYFDVFVLTTLIGFIAVVLCIAEWVRESRAGKKSGVVTPEAESAVASSTVPATPASPASRKA